MTSSCFTIINSRSAVDLPEAEFYTWETFTLCGDECKQYIKNDHKMKMGVLGLIFHRIFFCHLDMWTNHIFSLSKKNSDIFQKYF